MVQFFTIFTTFSILAYFDIALVLQALSSRQSFANLVSPSLQKPFISEITAKIALLSAHCERGENDRTIFTCLRGLQHTTEVLVLNKCSRCASFETNCRKATHIFPTAANIRCRYADCKHGASGTLE